MKKLFTLCATLFGILLGVSCTTPEGGIQQTPTDSTKPEITISEDKVDANAITFTVTTTVAGELGYAAVAEGAKNPTLDELFTRNKTMVDTSATITLEGLNDNTNYTLYAVLRSAEDGNLSDPKKHAFTTPDDGQSEVIAIGEIGYDSVSFTINLDGNLLFQCIDKASLDYYNQTPESYFETSGIAISDKGPLTVDWYNGGSYGPFEMRMREDSVYYIIAARADSSKNISGEIYIKEFKTLRKPQTDAGVTTTLKDITSTSVTIATTPDSTVVDYYIYVRDKAWSDSIVSGYGEAMLISLVKSPNAGSWKLSGANEATWAGLTAETTYYCHVLVIDHKGAESLSLIEFSTSGKELSAPEIDLSITEPAEDAYKTLNLNIYCENAASGKIIFRPTADVAVRRSETGYEDAQLINNYGTELSSEQIASISTTGLSIKMEDLWPEVEYTALVSIKNGEKTETIKATTHSTPKQPAAPRVESELFRSLLGEWELTYEVIQENYYEFTVTETVTIAQGVDEKSNADYRDQNRLVILGFPFNVTTTGVNNEIPVYTPADLLDAMPKYYSYGHNLIYRDYGPKIFLEIGEGDTLSVPSSKSCYLYNWDTIGYLNFFGCDIEQNFTAPATFPVTLSEDGNTLTIGACQSGEEFGYGVYRPAVFLNDYQFKACAKGDIYLRRVK